MSQEKRQAIFEQMATIYPHEIAAAYPEQFREFFERQCPGVSVEAMNELLQSSSSQASEI